MLRSEVRKIITTRTALGLAVAAAVVVGLGAFSTTSSMEQSGLDRRVQDQEFFLLASINLGIFALLMGVRSATDEFRHGTIAWTLLAETRRTRAVLAKAAVAGAAAGLAAGAAAIVMLGVALPMASLKGANMFLGEGDAAAIAGLVGSSAAWGAIGAAIGTLVRHQVAAVVTVLIWMLAIENLAAGFLGDTARFLPAQAAHAFAHVDSLGHTLSPIAGAVLLAAYAAGLVALAAATLRRRPVGLSA